MSGNTLSSDKNYFPCGQDRKENKKCHNQKMKILRLLAPKHKWFCEQGISMGPSLNWGHWIFIKDNLEEAIIIEDVSDFKILQYTISTQNCHVKSRTMAKIKKIEKIQNNLSFLDSQSLKQKIENSEGVIYVISPQMPLSLEGIKNIQDATTSKKFSLLFAVDPNINSGQLNHLKEKIRAEIFTIDALEFNMRLPYTHFPALIYFRSGVLSLQVKYGYETSNDYRLWLDRMGTSIL